MSQYLESVNILITIDYSYLDLHVETMSLEFIYYFSLRFTWGSWTLGSGTTWHILNDLIKTYCSGTQKCLFWSKMVSLQFDRLLFSSMNGDTETHSYQTRSTYMQGADMKRRPSGPVDRVVPGSRALSRSLLFRCHLGLLGLNALWAVEHDLNHSVLHQRGETKQQASDEPDVDGLDVGHFGQFRRQGGALRGQREHGEYS